MTMGSRLYYALLFPPTQTSMAGRRERPRAKPNCFLSAAQKMGLSEGLADTQNTLTNFPISLEMSRAGKFTFFLCRRQKRKEEKVGK